MRRYHIKIYLSDQSVIDARAEADSIEDAVDKIMLTDQAKEFLGDNEIESVQLIETEEIGPVNPKRFLLQESSDPGYWVVTDQQNGLVCKFLERNFNKTQKTTDINDNPITDPLTLATALREIGDFLYSKHPELIC